jgi:hypothetical protein
MNRRQLEDAGMYLLMLALMAALVFCAIPEFFGVNP